MCAMMTTLNPQTEPVKVYTLGRFVIKRGERTLSDVTSRSKKAWELFKYLIAHKDKTAHPELVLETLWPEQNYADPNVAMRALVYRLRQILEKELAAPELAANITCSHGCYKWSNTATAGSILISSKAYARRHSAPPVKRNPKRPLSPTRRRFRCISVIFCLIVLTRNGFYPHATIIAVFTCRQ